MVVGEPTLMGGEFGDEDERVITRLENQQFTNGDSENHEHLPPGGNGSNPPGVGPGPGPHTPGSQGGPPPPGGGAGPPPVPCSSGGPPSSQFRGSPSLQNQWGPDQKPQPEPISIEPKTE